MHTRVFTAVRSYISNLRFQRNAWLFLAHTAFVGVAGGAYGLLFNFYLQSLGYGESLMGMLRMVSGLVGFAAALPASHLCDRLGRKASLMLSGAVTSACVLGMAARPGLAGLYVISVLSGLAQSLGGVAIGPFLMENSSQKERTYLFSFNQGIQMVAISAGNWGGGRLPGWLAGALEVDGTSTTAYAAAIATTAGLFFLALLPLIPIRKRQSTYAPGEPVPSPIQHILRQPVLLAKLLAPPLVISIGAGMLMPFMNLFFRTVHTRSDAEVGTLLAWGSLAMGVGLLVAPVLAERWGKIRTVVITQFLSIPFLIVLGFSPWFYVSAAAYLVRIALMNMNSPVYQTFVLEQVDTKAQATTASLLSMSWNTGHTLCPPLSGWVQENYGFNPIFIWTISTYVMAILLTWRFFWGKPEAGGGGDHLASGPAGPTE